MNNTRIAKIFAILLLFIVVVQYKTESGLFKNTVSFEKVRMAIEYMIHGENVPLINARHDGEIKEKEVDRLSEDLREATQEITELENIERLLEEKNQSLLLKGTSASNRMDRLQEENGDHEYELANAQGVIAGLEAELDAAEDARAADARKLTELPVIAENLKITQDLLKEAEGRLGKAQMKLQAEREAERNRRNLSDAERLKLSGELQKAELKYREADQVVTALKEQVRKMQKKQKADNDPPADFLNPAIK